MAARLPKTPSSEPAANDGGSGAPPLSPTQRALVDENLGLVEACAASVARRFRPRVKAEELRAPGTLGLFEAARTFDFDRHPSFPHFATGYVTGRMLDAVRAEHTSLRARVERSMDRAFAWFSAHQVIDADLTNAPEEELEQKARAACDDALAAAIVGAAVEAQEESAEDAMVAGVALAEALARLPAHEREVVRLVHAEGRSFPEAARILRVHVNTIQNRLASASRRLRPLFAGRR